MGLPAVTPDGPVLVIARSATGVTVSVSVALLAPGPGSVVPAGAVIVAVLDTLLLVALTLAAIVISKNCPEARAGRAKPPTLSSWAAVGVVPTVHWPGVPEQATVPL